MSVNVYLLSVLCDPIVFIMTQTYRNILCEKMFILKQFFLERTPWEMLKQATVQITIINVLKEMYAF